MSGELMVFSSPNEHEADLAALRDRIAQLQGELRAARAETATAKRQAEQALSALRKQLSPLYRALQAVFGEIENAGLSDEAPHQSGAVSAVWESWKSKLGPMPARFIDALLLHRDMNVAQLRIACQCGQQTVYDNIAKLNKAGLINKAGGRFSLKQL